MPSTSQAQADFMNAVKHNPKFAKKVGVPQSVGRDFHAADKRQHKFGYARGGLAGVGHTGRANCPCRLCAGGSVRKYAEGGKVFPSPEVSVQRYAIGGPTKSLGPLAQLAVQPRHRPATQTRMSLRSVVDPSRPLSALV